MTAYRFTEATNTPLRRWRLRNNLRQVDVARPLGIAVSALCMLERQQARLNPVDVVRVARRLEIAIEEIAEPTSLLDKLDALTDAELEELALAGPCRRLAPRGQAGRVA